MNEPTYDLNLTAEQLKVLSQALMAYEHAAIKMGQHDELCNETYRNTFFKVSDALNDYYHMMGIK